MKSLGLVLPLLGSLVITSCGKDKNDSKDAPVAIPETPAPVPDYEFAQTSVSEVKLSTGFAITAFPGGVPMSIGSGLRMAHYDPKTGEAMLYGMTDRGPNGDSPAPLNATAQITATKVFPLPDFQPSLYRLSYSPKTGLKFEERIGLTEQGKAVSGRPIPAGAIGTSLELGLSEALQPLAFDPLGIDPEGIDFDKDGNAWICDEYGPFLAKVDIRTGAILKRYAPGSGLPLILAQRQPNRGFEGLAVSDGKVYAVIQSTLDVNGKTKKVADFIRVVEFDPASGATRMFAYPIDAKAYSKTSDAKLGDLVALGNGRFAVIEQGTGADKAMHNAIYGIDLKDATDLSGKLIETGANAGKDLEYTQLAQLPGIQPVRKVFIADLRASGWTQEKAEGLTLLNDKTLMIASDNDFGLKSGVEGGPSASLDDYQVDDKGALYYKGAPTTAVYKVGVGEAASQVMILKGDRSFSDF